MYKIKRNDRKLGGKITFHFQPIFFSSFFLVSVWMVNLCVCKQREEKKVKLVYHNLLYCVVCCFIAIFSSFAFLSFFFLLRKHTHTHAHTFKLVSFSYFMFSLCVFIPISFFFFNFFLSSLSLPRFFVFIFSQCLSNNRKWCSNWKIFHALSYLWKYETVQTIKRWVVLCVCAKEGKIHRIRF